MQKTMTLYKNRNTSFRRASTLIEKKLRAVGESRGFAITRLLTHWSEIVGLQVSEICVPVKISYAQKGFGATLLLLTTGSHAQMLEMQLPKIQENVNACYGYNAIARVRITQTAPTGFSHGEVKIQSVAPPKNLISNTKIATKAALISEEIKDEGLRTALSTFGENILKSEKRL